jgi:hypothetical protein
MQINKNR